MFNDAFSDKDQFETDTPAAEAVIYSCSSSQRHPLTSSVHIIN